MCLDLAEFGRLKSELKPVLVVVDIPRPRAIVQRAAPPGQQCRFSGGPPCRRLRCPAHPGWWRAPRRTEWTNWCTTGTGGGRPLALNVSLL